MDTKKTWQWLHTLGTGALVALMFALVVVPMLSPTTAHAEGSKELTTVKDEDNSREDLTDKGDVKDSLNRIVSYRPWLTDIQDITFAESSLTTMFNVYAKKGETINVASSAVITGAGAIEVYDPLGKLTEHVTVTGTLTDPDAKCGKIENRDQELAGPILADGDGGGYTPCTITVADGQDGIWQVRFVAPGPSTVSPDAVQTNVDWKQDKTGNFDVNGDGKIDADEEKSLIAYIAAWDITVAGEDKKAIDGRVYANYLPLRMAAGNAGVYSILHVLTNNGTQYEVNMNGIAPEIFVFFANNKGFTTNPKRGTKEPIYRSLQFDVNRGNENVGGIPYGYTYHKPSEPDTATEVTHKLFFNTPHTTTLPISATRAGKNVWLDPEYVVPPEPNALSFTLDDENPGGDFTFVFTPTNGAAMYSIIVDTDRNGVFGDGNDPELVGDIEVKGTTAVTSTSTISWDGKDYYGKNVPAGTYEVQLLLRSGEVHFPLIDPEFNDKGIKIKRLNGTGAEKDPERYRIFFDNRLNAASTPYDFSPCANGEYNLIRSKIPAGKNVECLGTIADDERSARNGQISIDGGHKWEYNDSEGFRYGFGDKKGMDTWAFNPSSNVVTITLKLLKVETNPVTAKPGDSPTFTKDTISVPGYDGDPKDLIYTLTEEPENGTLYRIDDDGNKVPLEEGDTFTQADIDAGRISYEPNDDDVEEDAFAFTVKEGEDGDPSDPVTMPLTFNSKPKVETSPLEDGKQGGTIPLTKDNLKATDKENDDPAKLKYTLLDAPTKGDLLKDGVPLKEGDTFTQADIDDGKIAYQHTDDSVPARDENFTLKATDADGVDSGDIPMTISFNNDPTALEGNQGGTTPLTDDTLDAKDGANDDPAKLTYTLSEAPTKGNLLKDGKPLKEGDTFTQQDIDDGKIDYEHTDDSVPAEDENFKLKLTDPDGKESSEIPVTISFNDPTALEGNQGGTTPLTNDALDATDDANDDPAKLKYTLSEAPTKGVLKKDGKPLKEGDTFTQKDIDDGKIDYEHTDDSVPAEDENFKLKLTDPDGKDKGEMPVTISFNNKPTVASAPVKVSNPKPGMNVPITADALKATDREDTDPEKLTYTLAKAPEQGNLTKDGIPLKPGDPFTQKDIDDGKIAYDHTGDTLPIDDTFAVKVKDSDGAESDEIPVTFAKPFAVDKEDLLVPPTADGGAVPITGDNLKANDHDESDEDDPAKVTYTMVTPPTKGKLLKDGEPMEEGDTFTQQDIDDGKIAYQPLDEDATEDSVGLKLTDDDGTESEEFPFNVNFKKKPTVDTQPLQANKGGSTPLGKDNLKPSDVVSPTTGPLTYTLVAPPTKGKLLKDGVPVEAGDTFTQDEIDDGSLVYEHTDDTLPVTDDEFTFTVTNDEGVVSDELPFVITFDGLEMDLVCDTFATAGSTLYCTVVYTNTGTITTTDLTVGMTQPANSIMEPSKSDPRWLAATGAVTSTDRLTGEPIVFDYMAPVDSLAPNESGAIKIAFRVDNDLPLSTPLDMQAVFQDHVDNTVVQEAQDNSTVNVAKAIYLPLVPRAMTQ